MKAVAYLRVSTKEQAERFGLPAQRAAIRSFCDGQGITIIKTFEDAGVSAKTVKRPGLQELLKYCVDNRQAIEAVVVHKIDRLSRQNGEYHQLKALFAKNGVRVISASEHIEDTPAGKFLENMLASAGQLENDMRAERTRVCMKEAFRGGRWLWRAPFGYVKTATPSLTPDPEKATLIAKLFIRYAEGDVNKRELGDYAFTIGLRTNSDKRVPKQTIDKLLRNPIYKGSMHSPKWGESHPGDFDAIVDELTFERVQALLSGRQPTLAARKSDNPNFPLRRFIRCANCQGKLTGSGSTGSTGKKYSYYRCNSSGCRAVNVRAETLESHFEKVLTTLAPSESLLRLFSEIVRDAWQERHLDLVENQERIARLIRQVETKEERLLHAYLYDRVIDRDTYGNEKDKLAQEKTLLRLERNDNELDELNIEAVIGYAAAVLKTPARMWREMQPKQRLRFQTLFFPDGLEYDGQAFGTPKTSSLFKYLGPSAGEGSTLASPRRFELRLPP